MALKWSPSDIPRAEREIITATENYNEKKSEYFKLLDKRSEYEDKIKKELDENFVTYQNCSFYMLDPVTLTFKGYTRQVGNLIKSYELAISALKPEIDLAFLTKQAAFKRLLKAKRRLSDAKNGFPYICFVPVRDYY